MNFLKAIVFGIVEGVTEWLPISSTAHMIILNCFMPLETSKEFYNMFEVVIQLAAVLSLLLVYIKKIWPFGESNKPLGKGALAYVKKDKFILWIKISIACLPAIIYKLFIEECFTLVNDSNRVLVVGSTLLTVGIIFIGVEWFIRKKAFDTFSTDGISYTDALIIGLAQIVAGIFPGVSRSGATIIAGLLLYINRTTITDFTFELSLPVMFGASLMEILEFGLNFTFGEVIILLLGCISAFMTSIFMIKFILSYIKKNNFVIFGIYRIIMGIIVLIFLA